MLQLPAICGSWSNSTTEDKPLPSEAPTLHVKVMTACGGLEVKH